MEETRHSGVEYSERRSHTVLYALIAGGVVVAVLVTFLVGFAAYSRWIRQGRRGSLSPVAEVFGLSRVAMDVVMEAEAPAPEMMPSEAYDAERGVSIPMDERLIIRDGTLTLVVTDPRAAQGEIQALVAEMAGEGAYVVSSQERGGIAGVGPYIAVRIRVPAARFDETMDRVAKLAVDVTHRNESAQDITEEYVDLEARLESLEAARQRLLGLMEDARTTEDLLRAEQQLTEREATIEALKGRMQYLSQAAHLASIQIELQPYPPSQPVSAQWRPAEAIRRSLDALLGSLQGAGDFLIFFTIAVLPWIFVVGLAGYWIVRLVLWKLQGRRERKPAT